MDLQVLMILWIALEFIKAICKIVLFYRFF